MNVLKFLRGANNEATFIRSRPTNVTHVLLTANVVKVIAVPAGAKAAIISFDGDVWVRPNANPAVPVGDVTDGTGSELNPVAYDCDGVTDIRVIAEVGRKGSVTFYQ